MCVCVYAYTKLPSVIFGHRVQDSDTDRHGQNTNKNEKKKQKSPTKTPLHTADRVSAHTVDT